MLSVRDVTVAFGSRRVLDGVDLEVAEREIVALTGPSGSGKSTLLRVVAGIIEPDRGTVRIGGSDVTRTPIHRRRVGMVFQDLQLFPHRSVADNIGFGLKMAGVDRADRARRVAELLELIGLRGFGSRSVTSLSGGEARRVAVARSIAPRPAVLLLDEPFTGLDDELHDRLVADIGGVLRETSTTALMVTHDRSEAAAIADRTVSLTSRSAPPEDPPGAVHELRAADTHALRRTVLRQGTPSTEVRLPGDDDAGTVHLGIRDADGAVVATSTWLRQPFPGEPTRPGVQLRAMATDPAHRGTGLGAVLLRAGIDRARSDGAEVVWAKARVSALGFYEAGGMTAVGDEYLDADTALPHRVVMIDL